jgi:hypothetical protein
LFRFDRELDAEAGLAVSAEPLRLTDLLLFVVLVADPGTPPPDNGLGGRLDIRELPFGGCGKAATLIVRRIVLPAAFTPGVGVEFADEDAVRGVGRPEVEVEGDVVLAGKGKADADGIRRPDFGSCDEPVLEGVCAFVLLRVFEAGSGGKAVVGGPNAGLEGRGRVAAIVVLRGFSLFCDVPSYQSRRVRSNLNRWMREALE